MELEKTETEIKKEITDYLKGIGWKVYRMHAGRIIKNMHNNIPGTPDLFAVGDHFTLWIETKKPGKSPTAVQLKEMVDLSARGEHCLCAHSVDEVKAFLKRWL